MCAGPCTRGLCIKRVINIVLHSCRRSMGVALRRAPDSKPEPRTRPLALESPGRTPSSKGQPWSQPARVELGQGRFGRAGQRQRMNTAGDSPGVFWLQCQAQRLQAAPCQEKAWLREHLRDFHWPISPVTKNVKQLAITYNMFGNMVR